MDRAAIRAALAAHLDDDIAQGWAEPAAAKAMLQLFDEGVLDYEPTLGVIAFAQSHVGHA